MQPRIAEPVATSGARPTPMMLLRYRLHPYRRHLKWLRYLARWQMCHLPFRDSIRRRIVNWVDLLTLDQGEDVIWRCPQTGLRYLLSLDCMMQREMYYAGAYQPEIRKVIEKYQAADCAFVDVGANIGQHSLVEARRRRNLGGQSKMVFAFEPDPALFQRLQYNVGLNSLDDYISCNDMAISDEEGAAIFYLATIQNTGVGSLAKQPPIYGQSEDTTQVRCTTLDAFFGSSSCPRIGLMKLDIEGAEFAALKGARGILAQHRPALVIEAYEVNMKSFGYSLDDLHRLLVAAGYSVHLIKPEGCLVYDDGSNSPTGFDDLLCLPLDRPL